MIRNYTSKFFLSVFLFVLISFILQSCGLSFESYAQPPENEEVPSLQVPLHLTPIGRNGVVQIGQNRMTIEEEWVKESETALAQRLPVGKKYILEFFVSKKDVLEKRYAEVQFTHSSNMRIQFSPDVQLGIFDMLKSEGVIENFLLDSNQKIWVKLELGSNTLFEERHDRIIYSAPLFEWGELVPDSYSYFKDSSSKDEECVLVNGYLVRISLADIKTANEKNDKFAHVYSCIYWLEWKVIIASSLLAMINE